ncbi:MAG TPA: RNA polymerase subunit sigma-70 [Microscillaceae bacterium]|jgi:RNA polymerase sigma factor (sigma-70 family)|nr:RNA polymerase subunit sigma-70 [Microscillaceae bacterium]
MLQAHKHKWLSEAALQTALQQGQADALRYVYQQYYGSIAFFVINNQGSEAEAKDVFQESMIVLLENLQKPDFSLQCSLKTFLYSITRRKWLKKLVRNKPILGKIEDHEAFLNLAEEAEEEDNREQQLALMQQAMQMLGEPCSGLLNDFYVLEKTMQEISQARQYTNADNAKNQKYKCLVRLRKIFFTLYA